MIRFVQHTDIDPVKWDATVQQALFPTILCTYDMLNVLSGDAQWHALVQDDYVAVMPLPARSKMHVHYLYTPFFISQMGIFSSQPVSAQLTKDFLNALPRRYKQVDLLLNVENDTSSLQVNMLSLISHQLHLNQPYEQLYAAYSQNTQRNIKSAHKQALRVTVGEEIVDDIIRMFCESKGADSAVHYKDNDYATLKVAAQKLKAQNRLDVLGVRNADDQLIAGALLVRDYQRLWFWFSGRDNAFAQSKSMFFLLDEYIRQQAQTSYILDFNGSMNENVARLYKSFGGQPYTIPMVNQTSGIPFKTLLKVYKAFSH